MRTHWAFVALISTQLTGAAWAAPAPACADADECQPAEDEASLLQTKARLSSRTPPMSPLEAAQARDPLELPNPIWWVHVPKCGTSFLNTLIHLPGTCPGLDPSFNVVEGTHFARNYNPEENCPGLETKCLGGHTGIGSTYDGVRGRLMTFLRQPEQRLISDWLYRMEKHHGAWTIEQWVAQDSTPGCAVKMLVRDGKPCSEPPAVTASEAALARQRLREGFAFVGITDEWDLSICLFNRMFGVPCQGHQFGDARPGILHTSEPYGTARLGGFRDLYDGALFEEAQAIFRENLALYNVSWESCEPCFRQAAADHSDAPAAAPEGSRPH